MAKRFSNVDCCVVHLRIEFPKKTFIYDLFIRFQFTYPRLLHYESNLEMLIHSEDRKITLVSSTLVYTYT